MSSSLASAGSRTHLKVVVVSLMAGIVVMAVAATARVADRSSAGHPSWLPSPKETTLVTELNERPQVAEQIPCRRQAWPNIDRQCLSWTATANAAPESHATHTAMSLRPQDGPAPRKDEARVAAPDATPTGAPPQVKVAVEAPAAPPVKRVKPAHDTKLRVARQGRSDGAARRVDDDLSDVPVSSFGAAPRRGVIRPTNPQDAYYYASRPASGSFDLFGLLHRNVP
jgi:hypothetical protein